MTVIHVADGGPFDLTGLALRLALDLAMSGEDVRFADRRSALPAHPLDPDALAPHHAARLPRSPVDPALDSKDWLVGPPGIAPEHFATRHGVPPMLAAGDERPGSPGVNNARPPSAAFDRVVTPWHRVGYPAAARTPGTLELAGLALGTTLELDDLAGTHGRTPYLGHATAVSPELLAVALGAIAERGPPYPTIAVRAPVLDAAFFPYVHELGRWPGPWRLIAHDAPDASIAASLIAARCSHVDLRIPTPCDGSERFACRHPDDTFARLRSVPAPLLPIALRFLAGIPGETPEHQRQAIRHLARVARSLAAFSARPFAPGAQSKLARHPIPGVRHLAGEGPHGWLVGHNNDAWRRKLAREYQIAAESLGIPLADPFPLGRDLLRHKARIARRLTDAFDGATPLVDQNRDLVGVIQGERAYAGPGALEIDLTNDCNNTCVGCWCHSLQMGELKFAGAMKRQILETEIITKLLDDAWAMGTRKVQLAGSGEPFMHPDVMKILAHAKGLGYEVTIVTNLNFITRERADKLVELGVDRITASVWAGTAETYVATHPNQTEKSFERLRDVLGYLWARKRALGRTAPLVKMYHVVSSINCRDLEPMVALAVETGCEQVELQITDIVPGRSDALALSDEDREAVIAQLGRIAARAVDPTRTAARGTAAYAALDALAESRQFGKFEKPTYPGWNWADPLLETIHCPRGNEGSLSVRDFCDDTETRYYYFWSVWDCHRCPDFTTCPIDKSHLSITKEFTELVGFGSFYRRVASMRATTGGEVHYEEQIVDRIPCTIGWTYSRVRVSGEVIPCCKGHLHPLGDLHQQSFADIWFGPTTDELRRMGKHQAKAHPYFSRIRCYASCDNVGHNLATANRLAALDPAERALLESAAPDTAYSAPPGEFLLPRLRPADAADVPGTGPSNDPGAASPPTLGDFATPQRDASI